MDFWRFIDTSGMALVSGQYDYPLVIASWLIASMAAYCGLSLRKLIQQQKKSKNRFIWLGLGGLSIGVGIWAMHFMGMIAFKLPIVMSYDPVITLISMFPAVIGAAFTLHLMAASSPTFKDTQLAAIVLAVAIGSMHYVGMEAMRMPSIGLAYDIRLFGMSLLVAYLLALCALFVRYFFRSKRLNIRLISSGLIGLAVSGMHYTAMMAAKFYPLSPGAVIETPIGTHDVMAIAVLAIASVIILFVVVVAIFEQRLNQLAANHVQISTVLPDGLIGVDENLQVVFSNPAAQQLFEYSDIELSKLYISQLVPSWNWGVLNSVKSQDVLTVTAQKKYGGKFTLEGKVAPQVVNGTKQMLIVVRDVSEQQEREQHVRRLVLALEQAADGIYVASVDNENIFMNKAMMTLIESSSEKLEISQFMSSNPEILRKLAQRESWTGHFEISNRNESTTHLDVSVSPILDTKQDLLEYLVVCRNITDLKATEGDLVVARDKAELATQAKSDFLAMVSHEIRTPMNGLLGLSSMLADTELDQDQQTTLRLIQQSGENLLTIINDILDFSKVEAGKLTIDDAPMSLQDLLRDVVDLFVIRGKEKPLRIELNIEDEMPPRVYGDAGRIKQVLMNLIGNAYKFTEAGQITINVARRHSFVPNLALFRISVIDTGIGMNESALGRIFEAFTQADASTNRRFGGTGLGLPISKQLVELMGGKIGASSVEGQGSVFWFELPLALVRDWAKPVAETQVIVDNFEGISILLVEDNPVNRKVASHMLKKFGCSVDIAEDGTEAIKKSKVEKYDIILMDCSMPDIDGFEATRRIRIDDSNPNKASPIIALTARAMQGDREACLAAGMNDYVTKPIRTVQLTTVLNHWARLRGLDDKKKGANLAN